MAIIFSSLLFKLALVGITAHGEQVLDSVKAIAYALRHEAELILYPVAAAHLLQVPGFGGYHLQQKAKSEN
jgi:hypothetical protein